MTDPDPDLEPRRKERPSDGETTRLSPAIRVGLYVLGTILVAVGVAGLVLPGIQGILTIVLGLAVISVASEATHHRLRHLLQRRWPRLWGRIEELREKVRRKLSR